MLVMPLGGTDPVGADKRLWVITDEIYEHLLYGDAACTRCRAKPKGARMSQDLGWSPFSKTATMYTGTRGAP